MTEEALRQEAEEQTKQYMSKHTEKYNCENTKLETDNYNVGREYGYEDGYVAGAWPRENRIADLEKENTELKTKKIPLLERKVASIRGCHRVDLAKLNARIEQVERLKKENTELRVSCKIQVDTAFQTIYEKDEQLNKATGIIKRLLTTPRSVYGRDEDGEHTSFFNPDYEELEKQAKQFLKEIEK